VQVRAVATFPRLARLLLLVPPLVPGTLSTLGGAEGAARGLVACAWLAWSAQIRARAKRGRFQL